MLGVENPLPRTSSNSTVVSCGMSSLPGACSQSSLIHSSERKQVSSSVKISTSGQVISSCPSDKENEEIFCGWGIFQPLCLQRFRSPQWVLFWLCWAGALQGLIVNGFINVVITTVEKRYKLKSTETGLIAGSYDIASFLCLIPISYLGGSRSKPFFIGSGLIILAFGSLVFSLPHFLAGSYSFSQEQDYHCHTDYHSVNYSAVCSNDESSLSNYKYVFFLGQLLHGAGAVPLYTLGCTFLDENVSTKMSSVYLGVFYTMAIVGPAIGYVLGGMLLKVYVDVGVDVKELGLSPSSTVWVGAWWIGFIFAAIVGFLISIPILGFPKTLPSTEKVKASKVSEMHQKLQDSEASRLDFGVNLTDLPASLKLLVTNPTFVFLSLAGASEGMLVAGLATFMPKLIESQFSYQASLAAFVVGIVTIPGAGGGNFLGGYLVKKFKMKCADIIRICIIFCLICLGLSFIFILHCPDAKFAGLNVPFINSASESKFATDCNLQCSCSTLDYDPVCGTNNMIYYSPCFAGCHDVHQYGDMKAYGSCSCINHTGKSMTLANKEIIVQATREKCSNNCQHGPLFLTVIFLCMFFTFLVSMPSLSATLRCVAESQKSFGLGVQWIAVRVLGTIPAPILFGWLIDESCILWQDSCKKEGACLFYNNQTMSTNILIIVCIVKSLSCVFFFLAWFLYQPPGTKNNTVSVNENQVLEVASNFQQLNVRCPDVTSVPAKASHCNIDTMAEATNFESIATNL